MTDPAVFLSEGEANDFSDFVGKQMAGTWKLFHGDRDGDDGCQVTELSARGGEMTFAAFEEACRILAQGVA